MFFVCVLVCDLLATLYGDPAGLFTLLPHATLPNAWCLCLYLVEFLEESCCYQYKARRCEPIFSFLQCWLGRVYFKAHWTRCSSWSLLRTWKVNMQKQIASRESISSWTEMTRTFLRFLVWRKWILMMWDLYNISLSVSFVRPPNVIYLSLP